MLPLLIMRIIMGICCGIIITRQIMKDNWTAGLASVCLVLIMVILAVYQDPI